MKKLIEKRAALAVLLKSMLETAKAENRAFTEDEVRKFDEAEAEIKALDATIKAEERAQNITEVYSPETSPKAVQLTQEQIEERAFADFIYGKTTEMRAGEQNLDWVNGSATVPTSIAKRIIDAAVDMCPILAGAEVYHEKGELKIPKWTKANSTHDVTVAYATEFTSLTADSGKFTSVDLGGYLAGALVLVGMSIMNGSAINVVQFVIDKIAEKVAQFLEGELLKGSGSNAAQGAIKTTNIVTTDTALEVHLEDLISLQTAIKQVYQKNACWTMSPSTFKTIKLLKDGDGRPLLEPDITKPLPYVLLGKPVYLSDNMDDIGANKLAILYGDYKGLSVNFQEDIAIQVLKEAYHAQHAIGMDVWFKFDSKVTDEQKLAVLKIKAS